MSSPLLALNTLGKVVFGVGGLGFLVIGLIFTHVSCGEIVKGWKLLSLPPRHKGDDDWFGPLFQGLVGLVFLGLPFLGLAFMAAMAITAGGKQ